MNGTNKPSDFRRSGVTACADAECPALRGEGGARIGMGVGHSNFPYPVVLRLFVCHYPAKPYRTGGSEKDGSSALIQSRVIP